MLNNTWQGFKKTFTKIEAHLGMSDLTVRDLAIKEALQMEIKSYTITQQSIICEMVFPAI